MLKVWILPETIGQGGGKRLRLALIEEYRGVTKAESVKGDTYCQTADGVEYTPHSMMHEAFVRMDSTKLELLDGFELIDPGHKFIPHKSNVRVIGSSAASIASHASSRCLTSCGTNSDWSTRASRIISSVYRPKGHSR